MTEQELDQHPVDFEKADESVPKVETYQDRVTAEKAELDDKLRKLKNFLGDPSKIDQANPDEVERLRRQSKIMSDYSNLLGERISHF